MPDTLRPSSIVSFTPTHSQTADNNTTSLTMTRPKKSPILLLDGTGMVPSRIARRLFFSSSSDKHPLLIASTPGLDPNGVKFDLYDPTTWENPFIRAQELFGRGSELESDDMKAKCGSSRKETLEESMEGEGETTGPVEDSPEKEQHQNETSTTEMDTDLQQFAAASSLSSSTKQPPQAHQADEENPVMIHSVYLTASNSPPSTAHAHSHVSRTSFLAASSDEQQQRAPSPSPSQQASLLMQFIDYARLKHGTRRFVLQSASAMEPGGFAMGRVHAHLRELGQRGEAEWAVLRPTWCQQDFEQPCHVKSIKDENKLYSATNEGKIPWVSADDIAAVAVQALTMEDAPNTEYLVLGPELLGYDDIANTLSSVLGRKIVHVDLSSSALERRHQSFGCSEEHSRLMSSLDTAIKYGSENRTNDVVLSMTGNKPKSFREYAESAKEIWV
ncbi:hypothetical protein QBC32DRAFT_40432 [Pseudoneurospora amorphoporcata]|uniref:Uncharacterized protein n=1 Tax=Pseudoneurospora amorphoporcata TaxID=241081 RepID=A0AAN6NS81_9PEZI|nr:hypothetical protein QBC32DRAFT_40432 [Pseudoneurospora amorphoporcata]